MQETDVRSYLEGGLSTSLAALEDAKISSLRYRMERLSSLPTTLRRPRMNSCRLYNLLCTLCDNKKSCRVYSLIQLLDHAVLRNARLDFLDSALP